MKIFINEFREFIKRGNVLDMAVGVVIGGAFGKITTSLVNDILMPFLGWLCGTRNMTALNVLVRPAVTENGEVVKEAITLGFGNFVGAIIDFLLIALVVFAIVKAANKAHEIMEKRNKEEEEEEKAEEEPKPTTEELLAQILEELKNK